MRLYLFGPLTVQQHELRMGLVLGGYDVRSSMNILDKDDYMNRGMERKLSDLPICQGREMLEAAAVVVTEECSHAEVMHLLSSAHFFGLCVVRIDDLPLDAIDCTTEVLDRLNLVQPQLPSGMLSRIAQACAGAWDAMTELERRVNSHIGHFMKNPMTRPNRAEAGT